MSNDTSPVDYRISNAIAVVVTIVWVLAWVLGVLLEQYSMPTEIHGIFLTVVTGIFSVQGFHAYRKRNNEK